MKGGSDKYLPGWREFENSFMTKSDQHHSDTHTSRRRKRQQQQQQQQQVQDWVPVSTDQPARYPCYGPCRVENKIESGNSNPAEAKRIEDSKNYYCSQGRRALQYEVKRRASMASVVLKSLSILLGIFFIFVGTTKLTPRVSKELYKELRKEFARYAKVFPLAQTMEVKIPSKWYRRSVGALEILCGICLTFVPSRRVKQIANLTLVLMMLFATYNHWMVGDKFERIAPSLVFFFMLTCRLIVEYQIKRKEKLEQKEKAEQLSKPQEQQDQAQLGPSPTSVGKSSSTGKEGRSHSGISNRTKKED